jgi:hypothetical protein
MPVAQRLIGLQRGGAFSPLSITGLKAWWDFSDATTLYTDAGTTSVSADAQLIYQANDKSGNLNHVSQATSGTRPTYKVAIQNGKSIARFNQKALGLSPFTTGTMTQPTTIFAVVTVTTTIANRIILDGSAPLSQRNALLDDFGSLNAGYYAGTAVVQGTAASDNACHTLAGVFNGASSHLYRDGGAADANGNPGAQGLGGIFLGATDIAAASAFTGDIMEVLAYDALLSATEINSVGGYLGTKWGLTWSAVS